MIISIDAEKTLDKIQHPFMIKKKKKNAYKMGIEKTYVNRLKVVYEKIPLQTLFWMMKNWKHSP